MADMYGYSRKVMETFKHPHNMGEMKDADALGKVGNVACGDLMWMYLKIDKGKDVMSSVIRDVKVKTFGCVAAIATSSTLTEMIKGKTVKEAMNISKQDIVDVLNGLPKQKIHCSILSIDALKEAIYDYCVRNKAPVPKGLKEIHERVQKANRCIEHNH